jgi:hypothetical protein
MICLSPISTPKSGRSYSIYSFVFFALIILFSTVTTFAEMIVDTAWVRTYDGPGNAFDMAYAVAVDGYGNVYVTGVSMHSRNLPYEYDYLTIKYFPNGDTAWVRSYDGPAGGGEDLAYAIAVDGSSCVCVTGKSYSSGTDYDYTTIKYYPNGDTAWLRRYNGPANGSDVAFDITLDGSGNIYVTGSSYTTGTGYDYVTITYNPNGDTSWVRRYNGPADSTDNANAIAIDDSDNVYVTGYSIGSGTGYDYATIKYLPDGDTGWVRRYNGPENSTDKASSIAVDDSRNVYVTGGSDGGVTDYDYATIKYSLNGDTAWVRTYNGPADGQDRAGGGVVVDCPGNVYVTGYSYGGGTYYDYATIKYDPEGEESWVVRYDGPGNGHELAYAIAVDDEGNVYVTGSSEGNVTNDDCSTASYDADGNEIWVDRYQGNVTNDDCATVSYDADGNEIWVDRYHGFGDQNDHARDIAADDSGYIYVTGGSYQSDETTWDFTTIKYVQFLRGDVNGNGAIDPSDIVCFINYLFRDGEPPDPLFVGDCNCDEIAGPGDVVILINHLFRGNPPPDCP